MDKHQRTMVEDMLPSDKMVNRAQDTNMDTERERPGKCLGALLLALACLLSWTTGIQSVESESTLQLRDCDGDILFYGRLDTDC